jgi:hypothetical protein
LVVVVEEGLERVESPILAFLVQILSFRLLPPLAAAARRAMQKVLDQTAGQAVAVLVEQAVLVTPQRNPRLKEIMVGQALTLRPISAVVEVEAHPQQEITEHQPLVEMVETERHLVLLAHPLPEQAVVVAELIKVEPLEVVVLVGEALEALLEQTTTALLVAQTQAAEAAVDLSNQTQAIVAAGTAVLGL